MSKVNTSFGSEMLYSTGRTDRHEEANSHFSHLSNTIKNKITRMKIFTTVNKTPSILMIIKMNKVLFYVV